MSTSKKTSRGFTRIEFEDSNGKPCILQVSSAAEGNFIWLGLAKAAEPHHVTHQAVSQTMHLGGAKLKWLVRKMAHFVETGDLQ